MTNTTDSASAQPIRVALLGCGVVGSQVARMIESRTEDIAARVGRQVELAGIAVAHPDRPRQGLDSRLFTDDPTVLVNRDDVDIVIELIGGIDPARQLLTAALGMWHSVVTANMALLGADGTDFLAVAECYCFVLYYEAAVAVVIPIVGPLR